MVIAIPLAMRLLSAFSRDAKFGPETGSADKFPNTLPGGLIEHGGYFGSAEQQA